MKLQRFIFSLIALTLLSLLFPNSSFATYNPLSYPNNKIGIHILFTDELPQAADLINSSGGDWGYVTIPIQASDKNIIKWQKFMDDAKQYHIIPIIRLATDGDYFNTAVWEKPDFSDILDFANFLNSLNWPTQNRYISVFNEVNRGDEWGGSPEPSEYAQLLSYAVTTFKSKSPEFFILSAGLDNAADNVPGAFMNQYTFMQSMDQAVPGIFRQVDGLTSHSYPNPGFIQPPTVLHQKSISSFKYEQQLAKSLSNKELPVFITETGWSGDDIADQTIANYFKDSLGSVWSDSSIIAITPFLLKAGAGPFSKFSMFDSSGQQNQRYLALKSYPKVKGLPPVASVKVLGDQISKQKPLKTFKFKEEYNNVEAKTTAAKTLLKWLLNIR